jgi:hypothetical protein
MNIKILQEIANKCGSELVETSYDSVSYYKIDDLFTIEPTDEPVLVRGLVEHPHRTNTKWQINEIKYDSGDRDTPPSSDYIEIELVDSLDDAVKRVLELIAKYRIEGHFLNAWEDEQSKKEEMFEGYNN